MEAAEEDELISEYPEWQRESILKARETVKSEDFVALPDQFEINEYKIMEDFCLQYQDRNIQKWRHITSPAPRDDHSGAR